MVVLVTRYEVDEFVIHHWWGSDGTSGLFVLPRRRWSFVSLVNVVRYWLHLKVRKGAV